MTTTRSSKFIPQHAIEFKDEQILKALEYAIDKNVPVLLMGETGTGKTSAIRWLAKEKGKGFRRLNLNGATTVDDIKGKILLNKDGTRWVDGVLVDAVRNGYWILLDEINAALPEVLFSIHSLIDEDSMLVLEENEGEVLRPHPDFRVFAAMNHGYEGTRALNKAFISRFPIVLNFNYLGWEDVEGKVVNNREVEILMERTGINEEQAKRIVEMGNILRKNYLKDEISFPISFRELIACAELSKAFGEEEAFRLAIVNKCAPEERNVVFGVYSIK